MRQVCPLCALEDYLEELAADKEAGTIDYECHNPTCSSFSWRTTPSHSNLDGRTGIAAEYGVHDDLLACIEPDDPFLEYGIIEYRYARLRPDIYMNEFIPRWGHTCLGPRRYTVSAFLASTLGSLLRSGELAWKGGPATGYWSYNHDVSYFTHRRTPLPDQLLSWNEFATARGEDPDQWPLPPGHRVPDRNPA